MEKTRITYNNMIKIKLKDLPKLTPLFKKEDIVWAISIDWTDVVRFERPNNNQLFNRNFTVKKTKIHEVRQSHDVSDEELIIESIYRLNDISWWSKDVFKTKKECEDRKRQLNKKEIERNTKTATKDIEELNRKIKCLKKGIKNKFTKKIIIMNLYKISQDVNNNYDSFDAAIICAENELDAASIHPSNYHDGPTNEQDDNLGDWCKLSNVKVELIGTANDRLERGVILASFNAG